LLSFLPMLTLNRLRHVRPLTALVHPERKPPVTPPHRTDSRMATQDNAPLLNSLPYRDTKAQGDTKIVARSQTVIPPCRPRWLQILGESIRPYREKVKREPIGANRDWGGRPESDHEARRHQAVKTWQTMTLPGFKEGKRER